MIKKVNLFIVGAMRSGTTSFSKLLNTHEDIFVPPIKEPHYFSDSLPKEFLERSRYFSVADYFKNSFPKPLHSAQIIEAAHYERLYSMAKQQKYLVDGSTSYLHEPSAADRIKQYNPSAKIIILTRNPLARAFSHYRMDVGLGRTTKSFEEVMQKEIELYKLGILPWYAHLNISFYKENIDRFQNLFDDVLVLSFENLLENTAKELEKISLFLGIAKFASTQLFHTNSSITIKRPNILYFLKHTGIKEYMSEILGISTKKNLLRMLSRQGSESVHISKTFLQEVEKVFEEENS
jgi:hypothetical protein